MSPVTIPLTGNSDSLNVESWADYLTPEQRVSAIAEILATAALRVLKERLENDDAALGYGHTVILSHPLSCRVP